MIAPSRRVKTAVWGLFMLTLAGCSRAPEGWAPVLEESSTGFLKTEAQSVASHVQLAQAQLEANPRGAAEELAAAEDGLNHLLTYYVPLLEARELAYNAYRHFRLGNSTQTASDLSGVETILLAIAENDHGHLLREMEEPLESLEDARAALTTDGDEAAGALQALANRLNFLLLKGGLVLGG